MERELVNLILTRLQEPRRFIQLVAGPRQVGKTTATRQAVARLGVPVHMSSADEPAAHDAIWLRQQWEQGRLATQSGNRAVLVIDEIQKVANWSETVKRLWDEDSAGGRPLNVLLLGSAQLLMQRGLTESFAGRYELLRATHWSWQEMQQAFGWDWEQYVYFGGYPGAAGLIVDELRWQRYIRDSLIESTLTRDILMQTQVNKPVLLRRLFELGCAYAGQELSYTKLLGQLQDAGNTVTVAHYLDLFSAAGLLAGLQKYAADAARKRGSSPKFQPYNTALSSALAGRSFDSIRHDPEAWGRQVECAVGAHLINGAHENGLSLYYWRDGGDEVDFVLTGREKVTAFEVKSTRRRVAPPGLAVFCRHVPRARPILVGGSGIPIPEFLQTPVSHWLSPGR